MRWRIHQFMHDDERAFDSIQNSFSIERTKLELIFVLEFCFDETFRMWRKEKREKEKKKGKKKKKKKNQFQFLFVLKENAIAVNCRNGRSRYKRKSNEKSFRILYGKAMIIFTNTNANYFTFAISRARQSHPLAVSSDAFHLVTFADRHFGMH